MGREAALHSPLCFLQSMVETKGPEVEACLDQDFGTQALLVMTPPRLREQLPSTVRLHPSWRRGRGTDTQPSSAVAERNADGTLRKDFLSAASAAASQRSHPGCFRGLSCGLSSTGAPRPHGCPPPFPVFVSSAKDVRSGEGSGQQPRGGFHEGSAGDGGQPLQERIRSLPLPPAGSPLNPCHCMVCFVLEAWLRSLWEVQHRFPSESEGSGTSPSTAYERGRGRLFLMLCELVSSPKGRSPLLPFQSRRIFPSSCTSSQAMDSVFWGWLTSPRWPWGPLKKPRR